MQVKTNLQSLEFRRNLFTPLERRQSLSAVTAEKDDGGVMLPSVGREAPVLTGFTAKFL